jgi:acyl-lipid omega-6 desaturase (Delta-12 desaturase)
MSTTQLLALEHQPIRRARSQPHDRELLVASKKFASEHRWLSWWHLGSTILVLLGLVCVAGSTYAVWIRSLSSILIGLTLVRMFIIYHDYHHDSIFRGSKLAGAILSVYGYLMLTPPSVWKRSHNHHHQHNSKLYRSSIGSFPIMTTDAYQCASLYERIEYRISRSPWTIVLGYLTVFLWGMCILPLLRDKHRHFDSVFALIVHFGLIFACIYLIGLLNTMLAFVIPTWVAMIAGSYLFYIQHNFPNAKIRDLPDWTYASAALESSSFLETGKILRWFTGNIGYHHIHHLNAKIPFYRLPEAMKGLAKLQSPGRTSFKLREIIGCLRLKLWDIEQDRFVTFAAASRQHLEKRGE